MANAIHIAPLQVERTQVVDTQTGNSRVTFAVDGIEIELTEKDKVKARNWNVNNSVCSWICTSPVEVRASRNLSLPFAITKTEEEGGDGP